MLCTVTLLSIGCGSRNEMKPDDLERTFNALRASNLLVHLNDGEIDAIYREATQKGYSSSLLIYSLPDVVYGFDSEYWWDPTVADSYVRLVEDLSNISRGQFQPAKIAVATPPEDSLWEDGDELALSFTLKDKQFRHQLEFQGDWVDLSFITKINQALSDTGSDGQYYWLFTDDQMVVVIFLTQEQHPVIKEILGSELRDYQDMFDDDLLQELFSQR